MVCGKRVSSKSFQNRPLLCVYRVGKGRHRRKGVYIRERVEANCSSLPTVDLMRIHVS